MKKKSPAPSLYVTIPAKRLLMKNWEYTLYEANDQLYLEVPVGTVAVFDVVIQLTPEERAQYENMGQAYLDTLGQDVTTYFCTEKYADRLLKIRFQEV